MLAESARSDRQYVLYERIDSTKIQRLLRLL